MFTDGSMIADARGGSCSMTDLWDQWRGNLMEFAAKTPDGVASLADLERSEGFPLVRIVTSTGRAVVCGQGARLLLDSGGWAPAGAEALGQSVKTETGAETITDYTSAGTGNVWAVSMASPPHCAMVDGLWFLVD
ncbi:MAG: hypothetical protein LAP21_24005 [Acidobacteriia bacterium]|nr:hypothetical protein [Terriglobia bacterium]